MDICIVGVKAKVSQKVFNVSGRSEISIWETYFWLLDWRQQSSTNSVGWRFVTPVRDVVDFRAPDVMDIIGLAIIQHLIQTIQWWMKACLTFFEIFNLFKYSVQSINHSTNLKIVYKHNNLLTSIILYEIKQQ